MEENKIVEGEETAAEEKEIIKKAMETEDKCQDSEVDEEVNDSGVGSEKEESKDIENNNFATPSDIKEKKGRKRDAGKVFGEDMKPRIKKKRVKKISREEDEELKPREEKVKEIDKKPNSS